MSVLVTPAALTEYILGDTTLRTVMLRTPTTMLVDAADGDCQSGCCPGPTAQLRRTSRRTPIFQLVNDRLKFPTRWRHSSDGALTVERTGAYRR